MTGLAAKLIHAARAARKDVTLIAPFIKTEPLRAILSELDVSIRTVAVIARWIPAEIAAGVCDLEIFDVVRARPNARLYVHPLLHAKLYRFDNVAFFGSANMTGKALGWAAPANIELLLSPAESISELRAFEAELLRCAIEVDDSYHAWTKAQVEGLRQQILPPEAVVAAELYQMPTSWLPSCAAPARLWNIYANVETWRMVEGAADAARQDLAALALPPGLTPDQFRRQVAAILECMPFIRRIAEASKTGITSEAAMQIIQSESASDHWPYALKETWEVLQKWLLHFFPDRYRSHPTGEIFSQGRVIG
jgi:hypothetical protein